MTTAPMITNRERLMDNAIIEMLTENTGVHPADSGGGSGRGWQRNRGHDFANEPRATIRAADKRGIYPRLSLYHWLTERLTYDQQKTNAMNRWGSGRPNLSGLSLMEDWARDAYPDASGIYGEGDPITVNTYNHESCLSQIIQYRYFTTEYATVMGRVEFDQAYVALQVHGGADARGGYTDPRVFRLDCDGVSIFNDCDATLYCSGSECEGSWYTDDSGYHWYPNDHGEEISEGSIIIREQVEGSTWKPGWVIVVDGVPHCPLCKFGVLTADL